MPAVPTYRLLLKVIATNSEIKSRLQTAAIIGRTDPFSTFVPDINLENAGAAEAGVSRRHAIIMPDEDSFLIKDLESANGTFINGHEIKPNVFYPLNSGDRVRLGRLEL